MAWRRSWTCDPGGGGLGVLGIAWLLGLALLPRLKRWRGADGLLLRLLAGLTSAPLLLLGVGQFQGAIFAFPWAAVALAGWLALALKVFLDFKTAKTHPKTIPDSAPQPPVLQLLTLAGWIFVAFSLLGRLAPAFCPPLGYDTLEYHQGILPNIFQAGRVCPIPHIFYSAQPLATEMLYTLAALIERTPWGYGPGVIHWTLIVLAAVLVARSFALLGILPIWRPWLLLLLLEHRLMFGLQVERMSDWMGVLMLAAGVWAVLKCGMRNAECGEKNTEYRIQNSENINLQSAIGNPLPKEADGDVRAPGNTQSIHSAFRIPHSALLLGLLAGGGAGGQMDTLRDGCHAAAGAGRWGWVGTSIAAPSSRGIP